MLESRQKMLKQYMAQGEEQTRRGQNELNSVENSLKVYRGQVAGLRDPKLMAKKSKAEQSLRNAVAADPRKQKEYGGAWEAIGKGRKDLAQYDRDRRFLDLAAGFNSPLFGYARNLVRLADEKQKPDAERLPEFMSTALPDRNQVYSTVRFMTTLKANYIPHVHAERGGANSSLVKKVLKGKT